MKKRIYLFLAMVIAITCLLAISAFAAEPNTSGETFTLEDGTALPLWDTDGNGLLWYKSTANQTDGFADYDCVSNNQTDSTQMPYVTYTKGAYNRQLDGKWITGYQINSCTITDANGTYNLKSDVIVANLKGALYSENQVFTMYNSTFNGNKVLEAAYVDKKTVFFCGNVFQDCSNLRKINLEETILGELGTASLAGCSKLAEIKLPSTLITVGEWVFQSTAITEITIPNSIKNWGATNFKMCYYLEKVYGFDGLIERGVLTQIPSNTFLDCHALVSFTEGNVIPSGVTSIGGSAFYNCKALPNVVLPSGLTTIEGYAFRDCDALKSINVGGTDPVEYAIILPEGITEIGTNAFWGVDTIKYIKLPSTLETLGTEALRNNDSLQYIDYNNCKITGAIGKYEFYDNKALVAVSLPSGITSLNADRPFSGCGNLEVLYLNPKMTELSSFTGCNKLYFTDAPFTLEWTDGMFDTEDWNGQKPQKPEIYYFPSGLINFGEAFNSCQSLSNTLVFPEGVTTISHQYTFYNISGKNFVFLGNVTSILQNSNAKSNYYFMNDSVTEETLAVSGNGNYNLYFHSAGNAHLTEKSVTVEADCVNNSKLSSLCFCGYEISSVENENTALGHAHNIFVGSVYADYSQKGYHGYKCERCDDVNKDKVAEALFNCIGYSAPENGNGSLVIGYTVNQTAVTEFETLNEKSISYGVFAVAQSIVGSDDVFEAENAVIVDMTSKGLAAFELKIVGFENDAQKKAKLALGAYVLVDSVASYMQENAPNEGDKYYFASYNDIFNS